MRVEDYAISTSTSSMMSMGGKISSLASTLIVGMMLMPISYSTTNTQPLKRPEVRHALLTQSTHSGMSLDELPEDAVDSQTPQIAAAQSTSSAISELRKLSGLTWDKLAEVFEVSRRSLHLWASGESLNEANEEHLRSTLAAIRKVDRGSAASNRALLLTPNDAGQSPIELLQNREYSKFIEQLGEGIQRPVVKRSPLSDEAIAARKPLPPDILIAANSDPAPTTPGRLLSARPLRPKHDEG